MMMKSEMKNEETVYEIIQEMRKQGLKEMPIQTLDGEIQYIRLTDKSFDAVLEITTNNDDFIRHEQYNASGAYTGTKDIPKPSKIFG